MSINRLALLRRILARLRPDDDDLGEVSAFVEKIWRSPAFPRSISISDLPQSYRLIYGALTPPGVTNDFPAGRAHRVGCRWLPDTRRKAPYIRLETKFYAELAGVSHGFESYAELAASGIVSKLDIMRPITEEAVYELTHTIFYLSDFGFWNMDLPPAECERTLRFIERLTDKCVQCDYWDMTGELIWTQFCLDGDPVHSASGTAWHTATPASPAGQWCDTRTICWAAARKIRDAGRVLPEGLSHDARDSPCVACPLVGPADCLML